MSGKYVREDQFVGVLSNLGLLCTSDLLSCSSHLPLPAVIFAMVTAQVAMSLEVSLFSSQCSPGSCEGGGQGVWVTLRLATEEHITLGKLLHISTLQFPPV